MLRICAAPVATAFAVLLLAAPPPPALADTSRVATVVWWQGPHEIDAGPSIAALAKRRGVAWIDVSPANPNTNDGVVEIKKLLAQGIAAYDALQFGEADTALRQAEQAIDAIGGQAVDPVTFSDVFLYRALAGTQNQAATAWDDFVVAAKLGSARVLDASRFSPRVIEEFARARAAASQLAPSTVTIESAPRCEVWWDGRALASTDPHTVTVETRLGVHWLASRCLGRRPVTKRITVEQAQQSIAGAGSELLPPTADELRISAQVVAARSYVSVVVLGGIANISKRNAAGGLLHEATQSLVGPADVAAVTAAVERMVAVDSVAATGPVQWYRRPWVWAIAGAVVTGAVLTPFLLSGNDASQTVTVRPVFP
ncbi:MAG TPA: hypothetical protein PLF40_24950 [Kofleriaceae bacterium]|nr:hypothetical protein [Kofleriaceae bacterium]